MRPARREGVHTALAAAVLLRGAVWVGPLCSPSALNEVKDQLLAAADGPQIMWVEGIAQRVYTCICEDMPAHERLA